MPRPRQRFCGVAFVVLFAGCPDFTAASDSGAADLGAPSDADTQAGDSPAGDASGTTNGMPPAEEGPIPEPGAEDGATMGGADTVAGGPAGSTTVGVDDNGDVPSEGTTGTDSSGSGSGSSTGEPIEFYGPCANDNECEPGFLCLNNTGAGVSICGLPQCEGVATCPEGPEGTTVACDDGPVPNKTNWCYLSCTTDGDCPTDTTSYNDEICVFPLPA